MPTMNVNDVELEYKQYGSGKDTIIFSIQQISDATEQLFQILAKSFQVFSISLRNTLSPDRDPCDPWYPVWAKDIREFSIKLGLKNIIYAGISHGAVVGWYLTVLYPELLKGFVSIVGVPQQRDFLDSESVKTLFDRYNNPDNYIMKLFAPTNDKKRLLRRQKIIDEMKQRKPPHNPENMPKGPGLAFPQLKTNDELTGFLNKITTPTLIFHGIYDHFTPPEHALMVGKSIPGAKTVFYQDESHMMAQESPEKVADEIKIFISELNRNQE
jgi:pimeloyl-ACP methyl ester carboxylesterase